MPEVYRLALLTQHLHGWEMYNKEWASNARKSCTITECCILVQDDGQLSKQTEWAEISSIVVEWVGMQRQSVVINAEHAWVGNV